MAGGTVAQVLGAQCPSLELQGSSAVARMQSCTGMCCAVKCATKIAGWQQCIRVLLILLCTSGRVSCDVLHRAVRSARRSHEAWHAFGSAGWCIQLLATAATTAGSAARKICRREVRRRLICSCLALDVLLARVEGAHRCKIPGVLQGRPRITRNHSTALHSVAQFVASKLLLGCQSTY